MIGSGRHGIPQLIKLDQDLSPVTRLGFAEVSDVENLVEKISTVWILPHSFKRRVDNFQHIFAANHTPGVVLQLRTGQINSCEFRIDLNS